MMILCSGGLYQKPIGTDRCLDCALRMKGNQPCGYGYRLLRAIFDSQEEREEIHVTDITGCLLKAYLDKKHQSPKYVHEMLVLLIGQAVHKALDVNDENVESEIPVTGLGVVGRMDACYTSDGRIEDAKTKRWIKMSHLNSDEHKMQINAYRALGKKNGRMQIQYIDVSGPTRCRKCNRAMRLIDGVVRCPICGDAPKDAHLGAVIVEVDAVENIEDVIFERATILQNALDSEIAPQAEPGWLCNYCPHVACEYNRAQE